MRHGMLASLPGGSVTRADALEWVVGGEHGIKCLGVAERAQLLDSLAELSPARPVSLGWLLGAVGPT